MINEGVEIIDCSNNAIKNYGVAFGSSIIGLNKEQVEALLSGKLLAISDGEYNTFLGTEESIESLNKLTGYKDIDGNELRVGMICYDEDCGISGIEIIEVDGEFFATHKELDAEPLSKVYKQLRINPNLLIK